MKITDFVDKNNTALLHLVTANYIEYTVKRIEDGELYCFSVPREDMGTGAFHVHEKSITLMRWIRKAISDGTMVKWQPKAVITKSFTNE